MKNALPRLLLILAVVCLVAAWVLGRLSAEYFPARRLALVPAAEMTRADLWYLPPRGDERRVIVLCPGYNGSGHPMVNDRKWRDFAAKHEAGIVGLSFASREEDLPNKGYYYAANGSGELLRKGVREIYGKDLPLYLYGFSGGGHFVARFMAWKPEAVGGWCAYAVGWWDPPEPGRRYPPGIVACGPEDTRYQACYDFFRQGRELDAPWLWCRVEGAGHEMSPPLETFARKYFAALLNPDGKAELIPECGLLPDGGLLEAWKALNGSCSPLPAGEPSPEGGR